MTKNTSKTITESRDNTPNQAQVESQEIIEFASLCALLCKNAQSALQLCTLAYECDPSAFHALCLAKTYALNGIYDKACEICENLNSHTSALDSSALESVFKPQVLEVLCECFENLKDPQNLIQNLAQNPTQNLIWIPI